MNFSKFEETSVCFGFSISRQRFRFEQQMHKRMPFYFFIASILFNINDTTDVPQLFLLISSQRIP